MPMDTSIPGYTETSDWPSSVKPPLRFGSIDRCRDGGPRGGTIELRLVDAAGVVVPTFFDNALGRLCLGTDERSEAATFVAQGSPLERELFSLLATIDAPREARLLLREALAHASTWTRIDFVPTNRAAHALPWHEVDNLILTNHKIQFLKRLGELGIESLSERLEILNERYLHLRATRDRDFPCDHETYWVGFYS
jgi:hypothetical protein